MSAYDSLPDAVTEIFGEEATAEQAYDLLTVDVPPGAWIAALTTARDELGCTYFDWLSAVDEPGTGFRVCAHVAALRAGHPPRRLLVRTTVPHAAPALPTAIGVYAGAGWHERETHEMFGVDFTGHPHLVPLLLPENFEGHPLRKDFVLAARVAKAWPGAKEPGESHDGGGPKRRQMLPPGVPDPNEWGPLKGQLPPAPARPARATAGDRPARRARSVTEGSATQPPPEPTSAPEAQEPAPAARPPRRSRSVTEGSASQSAPEAAASPETQEAAPAARPARRSRSVTEGSASQSTPEAATSPEAQPPAAPTAADAAADRPASAAPATRPARRSRSVTEGSASQPTPEAATSPEAQPPAAPTAADTASDGPASATPATRPARRARTAADGSASQAAPEQDATADGPASATPRTRSSDAPWHHARPAFDRKPAEPETQPAPATPAAEPTEAGVPAEPEAPATQAEEATPTPDTPAEAPEDGPPAGRKPATPATPATSATPATPATPAAEPAEVSESGPPAGRDESAPTEPTDPAGGDPA
ncbi:NADH-quinone oxidoreductase subunit C [Streptomyces sp. NPDC058650]|uniref:NADH-quinone oxidoreductase subunit C n=1 Tax=Streptomyces sp. NPDC058650 TaxID=3346575 RepID=UPI00364724F3